MDIPRAPGDKGIGGEDTELLPQGKYFGETKRTEMTGEALQDEIEGNAHEPLIIFHARGRKHISKMREYDRISLEICFFRKSLEYVRQWRDAFQAHLSDPVTGRNFEIVEMGDIEERSLRSGCPGEGYPVRRRGNLPGIPDAVSL